MASLPARPSRNKFHRTSPTQVAVPCANCGTLLYLSPCRVREDKRRFCDMTCREFWRTAFQVGENAAHFTGGVTVSHGRMWVLAPGHPYANRRGYISRARRVCEQLLGRYLAPIEVVHHLDENPLNDSPENLVVCPDQETHMRLYHSLGGRWSMLHESCVCCGTTERPHAAGGQCQRCYGRERKRRKARVRVTTGQPSVPVCGVR